MFSKRMLAVFFPVLDARVLWFLLPLVGLLSFSVLVARLGGRNFSTRYERGNPLLSAGEAVFYRSLIQVLGDRFLIFVKVRVADLISVSAASSPSSRVSAFNRISAKHVDFVLCDRVDFSVVAAVELDDKSHRAASARRRDSLKDSVFQQAGIPLVRVVARSSYSVDSLLGIFRNL